MPLGPERMKLLPGHTADAPKSLASVRPVDLHDETALLANMPKIGVGAETGSVREGRSEARVTVWRAALMKQPARPAPGGSGATNYSRQDAVRTF